MQLVIKNVSKQYKNKLALNKVNLTLTNGVYGFLGPNGAGKTTLMSIMVNILEPTNGDIYYNGKNIKKLKEKYCDIVGFLPQHIGYYPNFTGYEFLVYIAHLKGIKKSSIKKRVNKLIKMVNLEEAANRKIGGYSGGMKQRLGIAQAIMNNPKILILDEPTAGLDPKERIRFRNIISKLSENRIVILATHIVSDLDNIADKIILLNNGKLLLVATPEELINTLSNKVWESQDKINLKKHLVSNIKNNVIRIVSNEKPSPTAINVKANLEDIFLYYFTNQGKLL